MEKTQIVNYFLIDVAHVWLFIARFVKESFSIHPEVKEFFYQCFKIGTTSNGFVS